MPSQVPGVERPPPSIASSHELIVMRRLFGGSVFVSGGNVLGHVRVGQHGCDHHCDTDKENCPDAPASDPAPPSAFDAKPCIYFKSIHAKYLPINCGDAKADR